MRPHALALVFLCTVSTAAYGQEIYRWVDAYGEAHFGAHPPPGVRAEIWEPDAEPRVTIRPDPKPASQPHRKAGRGPRRVPPPHFGEQNAPRKRVPIQEPTIIGGRSEHSWRKSGLQLADRVEQLEERIEDARWESTPAHLSSLSAARWEARRDSRVERLEADLERAEQALEDLEDQARQAGVPPGWLR
jgi:hypothetical protein